MNLILRVLFLTAASVLALRAETTSNLPPNYSPEGERLVQAAEDGNLNEVKTLLSIGVPINAVDKGGESALFAASAKHPEIAFFLLDKGADVNIVNTFEHTSAIIQACYNNHTDLALALLDHGADPNVASVPWQQTALMNAAKFGNDQVVQALLAHHANVNANCNQGSVIYWAVNRNHVSTTKILIAAGATLDLPPSGSIRTRFDFYPLLGIAAANKSDAMIDLLLDSGAQVNVPSFDGTTALMGAVGASNLAAAKRFLALGADVNAANKDGETALIVAAISADVPTLQLLLDHHAKVDQPDGKAGDYRTPLMAACNWSRLEAAECLLQAGADVNRPDLYGDTALTYACGQGEAELAAMLEQHGARAEFAHLLHPHHFPRRPLTPAQSWALALCALYTAKNGQDQGVLGNGSTPEGALDTLKAYDIHNRLDLEKELETMENTGYHADFEKEGQELAALSDADFAARVAQAPKQGPRLHAARDAYRKWGDRSALAWDICRAAMLVNCAYDRQMLTEQKAWDHLAVLAQMAQSKFGSWEELNNNFLDGRQIWNDGVRDPEFQAVSNLLLDPKEPLSPWNQDAWQTPLVAIGN